MSPEDPAPPSLRSLGLSVYAPTFLFAVGQGAVIPVVTLAALDLGASVAFASLVVALRGIGVLCFDVPAGWLVSRFGERLAMSAGTLIVAASLLGAVWSPSPIAFAAFTFLMGCGWSVWLLARLSYVTEQMPPELRGRALSTLGGINRVGSFLGPFVGFVFVRSLGIDGAYYLHIATSIGACALLLTLTRGEGAGRDGTDHGRVELTRILREHAPVFRTAGVAVTAIGALRATRQQLVPLWGAAIGLDAETISLLFGLSTGIEVLLFYPAGSIMDRFGRKAVALPCLGLMSIGMLLLPWTSDFGTLTAVALLMGLGNGLGSGIVMTLGADLSPSVGRAQFLGAWRLCGDLGTGGGPLLASATTQALTLLAASTLVSLGSASALMGGIGLAGASLIFWRVPETLGRPGSHRVETGAAPEGRAAPADP